MFFYEIKSFYQTACGVFQVMILFATLQFAHQTLLCFCFDFFKVNFRPKMESTLSERDRDSLAMIAADIERTSNVPKVSYKNNLLTKN